VINGLKREELIASNSMILHELFFASLGKGGAPEGNLQSALEHNFGSLARWRAEFSAMGKAQGGGSGWVLLTWSPRDQKLINQWAMDHTTYGTLSYRVQRDRRRTPWISKNLLPTKLRSTFPRIPPPTRSGSGSIRRARPVALKQ